MSLPTGQRIVVSDTVGFINKLPHDLVEAFRATLEEVIRADLLLEVVDAADPNFIGQQAAVQSVLDELGAGGKPRITVFNKIDLLDADLRAAPVPASHDTAFVSAVSGEGLPRCCSGWPMRCAARWWRSTRSCPTPAASWWHAPSNPAMWTNRSPSPASGSPATCRRRSRPRCATRRSAATPRGRSA